MLKQGQEICKKYSLIKVYKISNYNLATADFIQNNYNEFKLKELLKELADHDYGYNFRIHNKCNYIIFGDIDHFDSKIKVFRDILKDFFIKKYKLYFENDEFKYTQNETKLDSYHYSIPKWHTTTEKLKEIHLNLIKFIKENKYDINSKSIDTTIYSEHFFRCPNQSKGTEVTGKHIIINGTMKDFIIEHIPTNSINITNINSIETANTQIITKVVTQPLEILHMPKTDAIKTDNDNIIVPVDNNNVVNITANANENTDVIVCDKNTILSTTMTQPELYKKMFDECYKQERFEEYKYWVSVGMAIKNTFTDEEEAVNLFDYYSAKGSNYEGFEKTKFKYKSFTKRTQAGYTIATIYYYAIEDNKVKFIEIINKNSFELQQYDICKYLKLIAGHKFIYKVTGENNYKLYCFNGKFWQNDDTIMRKCISVELYNFLKMVLIEVYWNSKDFHLLKSRIDKLKTVAMKRDIIETYKELGVNNTIKFDDKWHLLGFDNLLYDMEEETFRDYKYEDYIGTTTGYDWREPTTEELNLINNLINLIMPNEEERNLYLQILCTAIEGRCLEKFVIFCGHGGNGKGLINDLMLLALGNYALIGNNGILFEASKTGSNPEKANLHKKRLVIFREPPEKHKFENSIVKELTGGGLFSARSHHEKLTEKELNATIIVECNKKPLFAEEPTNADVRRIIDLYFRSTFTDNVELLNKDKHIYLANSLYKTKEWQEQHKFALMKILIDEHKKYYKVNNSKLIIPKSVDERTNTYLELSCNILQWFKENYELTNDNNVIKLKDIFDEFTQSIYYYNLTKLEKRKYNKSYFVDYFENNIFLRKYHHIIRYAACITNWTKVAKEEE